MADGYPRAVAVVAAICGDVDIAEDCVAEAIVRTLDREGGAIRSLDGWIIRLAVNRSRSLARRAVVARRHAALDLGVDRVAFADPTDGEEVLAAVRSLPVRHDRPFMVVRCFPDVGIRAVLHRSNGDVAALEALAIAGVPDAHVSSYPECPVLAVESGDPGPIAVTPDRQLAVHDDAGSGSFEYRARVGNKIPVEVARPPGTPIEVTARNLETGEMVLWEHAEPGGRPVTPTPVLSGSTSPVASRALGAGASTAVLGISVDVPAVVLFDFSSDGWSSQVCVAFTLR